MRMMVAAVIALAALGGCNKTPAIAPTDPLAPKLVAPPSAAEKAVAVKIVASGDLLPLDKATLEQIAGQQIQRLQMQEPDLKPEQLMAVHSAIITNLEGVVPQIREGMVDALTEQFSKPELDLLYKLVSTKEGKAINQNMQAVMEKSYQVADPLFSNATNKAVTEMKAAWPIAAPKPPAGAAPAPGVTPAPAQPTPAKPAKPTKPQ